MKRNVLYLIVGCSLALGCRKNRVVSVENPVVKDVEYHVFADKDYSAPAYANIKTDVRLQVHVINYKTGQMTLLWDSLMPSQKLQNFPTYANKIVINKSFSLIESFEKLNGAFSVKYDNNGTIQQAAKSDEAGPGKQKIFLEANL